MRMLVDQVANLPHLALGHQPAAVQQDDVRRERLDLVQDVTGDHHASSSPIQAADHFQQVAPGHRIGAGERLVQKQHARLVDQRLGQLRPLPHSLGVAADRPVHVFGHAHHGQGFFGRCRRLRSGPFP